MWGDGPELLATEYWLPNNPDGVGWENCAFFWYDGGLLADTFCTFESYPICQIRK